jgi:hypothetical protein
MLCKLNLHGSAVLMGRCGGHTCCETLASAQQAESFFVTVTAAVCLCCCRARFLAAPAFAGISVVLFSYLGWVVSSDAREKGLPHALASYPDVYFGKR